VLNVVIAASAAQRLAAQRLAAQRLAAQQWAARLRAAGRLGQAREARVREQPSESPQDSRGMRGRPGTARATPAARRAGHRCRD
jgi:hypothetical protein